MKTIQISAAVLTMVIALPITYAQSATTDSGLAADPVYKKDCAKCHGKTAEGRFMGGPSLISGKVGAASTEDLRHVITDGKGHMPKFAGKLTPEEIESLIKLIQASAKK